LIGFLLYFYINFSKTSSQTTQSDNNVTDDSTIQQPPSNLDILLAGGSSYSDPEGYYSFLYPNDYTIDTQDEKHIRVYKRAETARTQGEITDGVVVVLEIVQTEGTTLEKWVDNNIENTLKDGSSQIVMPKKPILLNTYNGYTYSIRGFGESTDVILQKDPESKTALKITYLVNDPNGNNYQNEVDATLQTIQLLK
jgi:hypothetical protein